MDWEFPPQRLQEVKIPCQTLMMIYRLCLMHLCSLYLPLCERDVTEALFVFCGFLCRQWVLGQVMNATQAHKKTGVLMRIAAYHAKNFEFIDTIEFSLEPVCEQQEYVGYLSHCR